MEIHKEHFLAMRVQPTIAELSDERIEELINIGARIEKEDQELALQNKVRSHEELTDEEHQAMWTLSVYESVVDEYLEGVAGADDALDIGDYDEEE